jgi:hypothetical protein
VSTDREINFSPVLNTSPNECHVLLLDFTLAELTPQLTMGLIVFCGNQ